MKHLIKDLEWSNCNTITPFTEYEVMPDGDKWKVKYFNKFDGEPAKDATGHITEEAAMQWANNNHKEKMMPWLNQDPLTDTVNWFKEAKPEPTAKDITTQLGCIFEEVAELAAAINFNGTARELSGIADELKSLTEKYAQKFVEDIDDIEALDATTDTKVTLAGFEYMMGYNGNGALKEVNASNWSKFENGKAVTDENGKIIKGSDYFKPELDKFVGGQNVQ